MIIQSNLLFNIFDPVRVFSFFIHFNLFELELLTQFPALNDKKYVFKKKDISSFIILLTL